MLPPSDAGFNAWFREFRRSWFRLETFQSYGGSGEDEDIRAFNAGRPLKVRASEYTANVRAAARDGRTMRRVHVITEPITDYIRYEVAAYAENVAAGEDVRIVPVAEGGAWPNGVPEARDFWLFDDTDMYDMHYGADGFWLGFTHVTDPDALADAGRQRDAALALAQPWATYVADRPELAERVASIRWP